MPPEPTQYDKALAWGATILDRPPWPEFDERITLLLVSPPALEDQQIEGAREAWLILDAPAARQLPEHLRTPMLEHGSATPTADGGALIAFSLDVLIELIEATARRSLELRWSISHAVALHDPLQRHGTLAASAGRLPSGAIERMVRVLFVQAAAALDALATVDVVTAGEAAASVARLACVVEEGMHPPLASLLAVARTTALGARLTSWFDDLPRAAGGDAAAIRRVQASRGRVRAALEAALRADYGGSSWFQQPDIFSRRPPR